MPAVRSVVITGCSDAGLGSSLALAFHERGYRVFATARNPKKMASLAARGIATLTLDVTSEESIHDCAVRVAEATGGSIDILVNNAGRDYSMPVLDISMEEMNRVFATNVYPMVSVTRNFFPLLQKSINSPMIVNETSVLAALPSPFEGAYNASKAAASMLTQNLRLGLECFGIKVVELRTAAVKSNISAWDKSDPGRDLPADSVYSPGRERVMRFSRDGDVADANKAGDAWAAQVLDQLEKPKTPTQIWKGGGATSAWLLTWFPLNVVHNLFRKANGLDEVSLKISLSRKQ
ncbi:NAD(P)-binding protein [Cadophora sp. DSE1049]|nr:NAD(P)-binding protein [Cadophora sp. DSE1049]